jgi:hypothetical protein
MRFDDAVSADVEGHADGNRFVRARIRIMCAPWGARPHGDGLGENIKYRDDPNHVED